MELSAHRKNALPPRKRQPSWHRPVGLVSLLAGVAIALSGCAVPRLSADEVLDGPQTAEARSAAITRVEQWPLGLIASGTTLVASQVYIEGQVLRGGVWLILRGSGREGLEDGFGVHLLGAEGL